MMHGQKNIKLRNELINTQSSRTFRYNHFVTTCISNKVKVKVQFTVEQATKAQRGSRGITLLFP